MFALFYITTVAVCKVISGTKNILVNAMSRNEAKVNKKTGYWDTNGAYRNPYTNEQIHYEQLSNGDRVLLDLKGNVLRNIDEEQRISNIVQKNIDLKNEGYPVVLIGKFEDVCPDKIHKGIWKHVPKKSAVYADSNGELYFRQPYCGTASQKNIYICVNNGEYKFLSETTQADKLWIDKANEGWKKGRRSFITLSKLADRVY